MADAERQARWRERKKLGLAGVRAAEEVMSAERDALADERPVDSPAQAARARLQIEVSLRRAVERAERDCKAGVLPEQSKVWFRAQVGSIWDEVRERLKAGDNVVGTIVTDDGSEVSGVVRFLRKGSA